MSVRILTHFVNRWADAIEDFFKTVNRRAKLTDSLRWQALKRVVSGSMVLFILSCTFTLAINIKPAEANGGIYIRADGRIDPPAAPILSTDNVTYVLTANITTTYSDGIIIERDNIVINGSGYSVQAVDGSAGLLIWGRRNVTARNMRILGFAYGIRLWGSSNNHINGNRISDSDSYGIEVWFSTHNDISANQITTGGCGVFLSHSNFTDMHQNNITENQAGIIVEDSSSNNIADNEVSATYPSAGLDMYSSANNSISGNSFEDCSEGVELGLSPYNVLRNNRIAGSNYSLHIYGYVLSDYLNAVDISNTVDGRPVYYWVSKHLSTVPTDAGYVALVNCTGITASNLRLARNAPGIMLVCTKDSVITSNDLTDNAYGVRLFESSNNTISYNNITANWNGISLESSDSNRIGRNNMKGNQDDGILLELSNHTSVFENNIVANGYGLNLCDSSEALIFHNNFIDNGLNVACYFSKRVPSNSLDNGYPSGGNYWSDYNGTDAHKGPLQNKVGGDGIGDTPYDVDIYYHDHYPLMKPWLRETITGDINHDGSVNIFDIVAATSIYGCRYGDPNWNPEADLASPYGRIDIYDLLTCVGHYGKKYP